MFLVLFVCYFLLFYSLCLYLMLISIYCCVHVVFCYVFFFSSRRRHTRCALVTGVQTCALPISSGLTEQRLVLHRPATYLQRPVARQISRRISSTMRSSGAVAITPPLQPREGGRKLQDSAAHSRTGVIREIDQPLRRLQRLPHVRGRGEAKFLGMRFRVGEAAIVTFLFSFALLLSVLTAEPVELPRCRVALGAELGQQSLDLAIPFGRDAADRVLALGDAEMLARCGGVGERLVAVEAAPLRGRVEIGRAHV